MRLKLVWAATGERHRREAEHSAASAQPWRSAVETELWTDPDQVPQVQGGLVDAVRPLGTPAFSSWDKIQALRQVDGEAVLFLDSDTRLLRPCPEIARLLQRCDIAGAHAPCRITSHRDYCDPGVPACFPELNSGVLALRLTSPVRRLLESWERIYRRARQRLGADILDQPALRQALWEAGDTVRLAVLPPEYNLRTPFPFTVGGGLAPAIVHGRGAALERAVTALRDHAAAAPVAFDFHDPADATL